MYVRLSKLTGAAMTRVQRLWRFLSGRIALTYLLDNAYSA